MSSTNEHAASLFSNPGGMDSPWQRIGRFLVRRRVAVSLIVFLLLISEDVLIGIQPHDLTNYHDPKSMIGLALVFSGAALRTWAAGTLKKSKQLATSGPYHVMRHPLYVGSFFMMVGFCTLIDDVENIWFVFGPILALYRFHVRNEELKLLARFGGSWQEYARSVPRFFPRRQPQAAFVDWQLSQWIKNREYRALGTVFLGLVALQLWRLS